MTSLGRCSWRHAESCLLRRFEVEGQTATSKEVIEALSVQVLGERGRKIEEVRLPSFNAGCVAGPCRQIRRCGLNLRGNPAGAHAALTETAATVHVQWVFRVMRKVGSSLTQPCACCGSDMTLLRRWRPAGATPFYQWWKVRFVH